MRGFGLCLLVSTLTLPLHAALDEAKRRFDLPASTAEVALKRFSEQSGRGVIFSTDSLARITTNAVRGEFTAPEAITHLLADTGLTATRDESTGAFAVRRSTPKTGSLPPGAKRAILSAPKSDRKGAYSLSNL